MVSFYFYKFIHKMKRNSIIKAYVIRGALKQSEELFKKMENEGIKPDEITW